MSLSKNTCTKYHCTDIDDEFQVEGTKLGATVHCFIQSLNKGVLGRSGCSSFSSSCSQSKTISQFLSEGRYLPKTRNLNMEEISYGCLRLFFISRFSLIA